MLALPALSPIVAISLVATALALLDAPYGNPGEIQEWGVPWGMFQRVWIFPCRILGHVLRKVGREDWRTGVGSKEGGAL